MNYFFITGSSKGLGKSLTELLLTDANNFIYGFARTNSINHENYMHTTLDFNDLDQVSDYTFPKLADAKKIILINNAGIVGDIKHGGRIDSQSIISCYNINTIAPAILTNNFMANYSNDTEKLIINISSGAGRTPIDGWSIYCSSKAGIDMFSQVLHEEIKIENNNCTILSLAPGIIDTDMQVNIRSSAANDFSNIEKFIEYKKEGDLASPDFTAKQVLQFINNPKLASDTLCSVRDLT